MDRNLLLQSNYLDIIFDGRNKVYGGYQLRTTYPQRMKRAGVYILTFAFLFVAYTLWANRAQPAPILSLPKTTDTLPIINPDLDIPIRKPPMPEPASAPATVNSVKNSIPDIVEDIEAHKDDLMATRDDLKDAVSSNLTVSGPNIGDESFDMKNAKPDGDGHAIVVDVNKVATNKPFIDVEQWPEFPGGELKLQEYLKNNIQYPAAAQAANQQGKVLVKFVVNEDGSITNVTTVRGFGYGSENESIRVVNAMPKWKPGRNNGKAVKVWFQVPIFFKLE